MILPPLYCIVDLDAAASTGWTVQALGRAFLAGGARLLQLRAKSAASGALLDACDQLATDAHAAGAIFIVNDRADVARLCGADGVHVGQDDLTPRAVREAAGPGLLVGHSTHNRDQVDRGLTEPIDYLAVGPIFGTRSKAGAEPVVGLGLVRYAAEALRGRDIPLVAVGGITLERAAEVLDAGASSVAVIADLLVDPDPAARVASYLKRLTSSRA